MASETVNTIACIFSTEAAHTHRPTRSSAHGKRGAGGTAGIAEG